MIFVLFFLILALLLCVTMLLRNKAVYSFSARILNEDTSGVDELIISHQWQTGWDYFPRYHALPSYYVMLVLFFVPLSYWEKQLPEYTDVWKN